MTDCQNIQALLDDWIDGLLGPEDSRRIDTHLPHCDACRRIFARHRGIHQNLIALARAADHLAAQMPRFGAPPLDKASDRTRRWLQAAAILLAVGIIWLAVAALDRHVPQPGHKDLHPAPTPMAARDHAPVQIAMLQDGNALIQDIPSADPHIHIRWIYPAVSAESTAGRSDTTLQP